MYTEFYGFTEKPFNLVPNPNYLYLSSKHAKALTFLEYGITERMGFIMLTGEIGIGKTTLVRHLLNQVEDKMDVAVLFNTNVHSTELIKLILNEFEIKYDDSIGKAKAHEILYDFLINQFTLKRKVLLVIDEAQNLSREVLEEIRMLSNLQTDEEMLLQIMIVGQPSLRDKIQDPRLEQFAQRISVSYHLSAMTLKETRAYIAHRLKKAGGKSLIFSMDVIKEIFEISAGIPRTINLLCDASLVYGYADEARTISCDILAQVVEEKGGMGLFIKQKQKEYSPGGSKEKNLEQLQQQISQMSHRIVEIETILQHYLEKTESRAEFCRDELVSNLKEIVSSERKRNTFLAYAYGKSKGKLSTSNCNNFEMMHDETNEKEL